MEPQVVRKKITPEELMRMRDRRNFELVDGELISKPGSVLVGLTAGNFLTALYRKIDGWVFPGSLGYRCFPEDPDRVRFPYVSVLRKNQWDPGQMEDPEYAPQVPALVVEVIAHDTLAAALDLKIEHWLGAGVELIWVADPLLKQVTSWIQQRSATVYRNADTITAEPVFPGFACAVSTFFKTPFDE